MRQSLALQDRTEDIIQSPSIETPLSIENQHRVEVKPQEGKGIHKLVSPKTLRTHRTQLIPLKLSFPSLFFSTPYPNLWVLFSNMRHTLRYILFGALPWSSLTVLLCCPEIEDGIPWLSGLSPTNFIYLFVALSLQQSNYSLITRSLISSHLFPSHLKSTRISPHKFPKYSIYLIFTVDITIKTRFNGKYLNLICPFVADVNLWYASEPESVNVKMLVLAIKSKSASVKCIYTQRNDCVYTIAEMILCKLLGQSDWPNTWSKRYQILKNRSLNFLKRNCRRFEEISRAR